MSEESEGHLLYGSVGVDARGAKAPVSIDWDTKALVTIDTPHYHIHQDEGFSYFHNASADAAASGNIFFITGANESHMRLVGLSTKGDNLWYWLYESRSTSGITSACGLIPSGSASINRDRRTNTATSNITWWTPSGVVSMGTGSAYLIDQHYVGGGAGSGANPQGATKAGGTQSADEEWELKPSCVYCVKWHNKSACANEFNARYFHYDIAL